MNVVFDGIDIHCRISGENHARKAVILHGWGASLETMRSIHDLVAQAHHTISMDLPGFGQSSLPPTAWNTSQYAEYIKNLLAYLHFDCPVIIGHSFGGKLAIRLGALGIAEKLILINSAGIVLPKPFKVRTKIMLYKGFKRALRTILPSRLHRHIETWSRKMFGSTDYRNADNLLREILVKTVNEDVRELLPRIFVPTLLIWGDRDGATPVAGGAIMESLIPDAGLVTLKDAGHFSYLDKPYEARLVIASFLGLGK